MPDKKNVEKAFWGDSGDDILKANPSIADEWSTERFTSLVFDPAGGPMYPKLEALHFITEVNPDTARDWLPENVTPVEPASATIYFAHFPRASFGVSYEEVGVFLHCLYEGHVHMLCVWMVLNDDTPMILGREVTGLPKKIADVDLEMNTNNAHCEVRRRGYTLLEVTGANAVPTDQGELLPYPMLNVRGAPGGGDGELLRGYASNELIEGQNMDLEIRVGQSVFDPLHKLELPNHAKGKHMIIDVAKPGVPSPTQLSEGVVGSVSSDWVTRNYPFRSY